MEKVPNGRYTKEFREEAVKMVTYGPERLQRDLADNGIVVGVHRIKRIRRKLGLRCKQKRKFKVMTDSWHSLPVAENLLNQKFEASAPTQVWLTDISVPQQAA